MFDDGQQSGTHICRNALPIDLINALDHGICAIICKLDNQFYYYTFTANEPYCDHEVTVVKKSGTSIYFKLFFRILRWYFTNREGQCERLQASCLPYIGLRIIQLHIADR